VLGGPSHPSLRDLWTTEDEEDLHRFLDACRREDLLGALLAIEGRPHPDRLEDEAQLTAWAAVAARRLALLPSHGPFALSRLLRGLLVDELGFRGDTEDYSATRNCCLHQVLSRRRGMPILLACVWVEVGRRAGIDIDGIGMPGHFLVRVGGPSGVHVDPFDGGQELSREGCRNLHDRIAGPKARWSDDFLRASAVDQVVERVLNNLSATTRDEHDAAGSYRVATFLAALRPASPERTLQKAMTAAAVGVTEEAASGFAEVIERFPDSPEAERASAGLDALGSGLTVH
jgi:regulator of sirC expression with transglutaminase-like and TPR domain